MPRRRDPWRVMRRSHLKVYGECRVCGIEMRGMHVHHLKGLRGRQRGTFERPGDLVSLCPPHHRALHSAFRKQGSLGGLLTFSLKFIKTEREALEKQRKE